MRATAAYSCRRLNQTTFLVVHDDKFGEHPFVYVKIYDNPRLVVVFDTGCGPNAAADSHCKVRDLKRFIEEYPVADNAHKPLNPVLEDGTSQRDYMIICTHCHYDHIGGIESFACLKATSVVASGNNKEFLNLENLPSSSLCKYMGIKTPQYAITHFTQDEEWLTFRGRDLRLQALHTPGHTPDSLAIYDEAENCMFIGDSFYRRRCTLPGGVSFTQAIVFPPQGSWIDFMDSMHKLLGFVEEQRTQASESAQETMQIACAHTTAGVRAKDIVSAVIAYFDRIVDDEIPVKYQVDYNGERFNMWVEDGDPEFSLLAPLRLKDEYARKRQGDASTGAGIGNGFCCEHRRIPLA